MKIRFSLFLLATFINRSYEQAVTWEDQTSSSCTTANGNPGECINIKNCPVLLQLLRNSRLKPGAGDFLRNSLCGYENKDPKVCCQSNRPIVKLTNTNVTTPVTTPLVIIKSRIDTSTSVTTASTPTTNTDVSPATSSVTTETSPINNATDNEEYERLSPPECGSSGLPQNEIVNKPAEIGAWPWVAALGYVSKTVSRFPPPYILCTGTLITSRHVLTSAHCNQYPTFYMYMVRLGHNNLSNKVKPLDVNIKTIITHGFYDRQKRINDIALLKLQTDVPFSRIVRPICLPKSAELKEMIFERNLATVAGWSNGYVTDRNTKKIIQLQLSLISNDECQRDYGDTAEIQSTLMCTKFLPGEEEQCQGDFGSPLMWKDNRNIYYMIGILSFGYFCDRPGSVSAYTRITSYIKWIEDSINLLQITGPTANSLNKTITNAPTTVTSPIGDISTVNTTGETSTVSTVSDANTSDASVRVEKVYELPSPPNCGNTTVLEMQKKIGIWPWVAALGYRQNSTSPTQWLCVGHLITSKHVITVGHCANHSRLTLYTVRLGIDDLHDKVPEGANAIDMDIENIILHPSYTGRHWRTGDIAILKLKNDVPLSSYIQPICLPKSAEMIDMTFTNIFPTVVGWGDVRLNGTSTHQMLQHLKLPIVDNFDCNRTYARKRIQINPTQLCAGLPRGGNGACLVNSGSPIMWPEAGAYYLIGLVSYAFGCAQPGYPDIFTRITSYMDWIGDNIK